MPRVKFESDGEGRALRRGLSVATRGWRMETVSIHCFLSLRVCVSVCWSLAPHEIPSDSPLGKVTGTPTAQDISGAMH